MNTKEPEQQEPLPHMAVVLGGDIFVPQRKPLTDEEIAEIMVQIWSNNNIPVRERSHRLARAIETAHGIKE